MFKSLSHFTFKDLYFLFFFAAVHLLMAGSIELSTDEAHYALYASHLDWSYFDHPPLVGWVQWPFYLLNGSDVAMRIVPMVCWLITAWMLVKLGHDFFPNQIPPRVAGVRLDLILYSAALIPNLLGIAVVPDTLLTVLGCGVMSVTWKILSLEKPKILDFAILGVLLGLSGLAKYTAVFFAISVCILIALKYSWRLIKNPGAWVALVIAVVVISPVFIWNYTHDWISFKYQMHHASGASEKSVQHALRYFLVLCFCYSLFLPLFVFILFRKFSFRELLSGVQSPAWVTLTFCVPSFFLWIYLAAGGNTLPHWAMPCIVMMIPYVSYKLMDFCAKSALRNFFLGLQFSLLFLFLGLMLSGGYPAFKSADSYGKDSIANPFSDVFGWRAASEKATELMNANGANGIAVSEWFLASRLAWYAKDVPVKVINSHDDQFNIWYGTVDYTKSLILVEWSQIPSELPIGNQRYTNCQYLDDSVIENSFIQISKFEYYLCRSN